MKKFVPPKEYYKNLAKKPVGSGVLLFNEAAKVLLVKPNYKDYWQIPGGVSNRDESPEATALRETKEELGLTLGKIKLLCVDWGAATGEREDHFQFVFAGDTLQKADIQKIKLQTDELDEYKFFSIEQAVLKVSERLKKRLLRSLAAMEMGTCVYLQNGELKC